MIASLLLLIETLFQDRLGAWAEGARVIAAAFLAAAWLSPVAVWACRRALERRRRPPRLYWRCACGRDNPPEARSCPACAASLPPRWEESRAGAALLRAGLWARRGLAAAGYALLYLLPLPCLFFLAPFQGGGALRELLAAAALIAAVAAAVLARAAAAPGGAGLVARGASLLAAGGLAGASLLCGLLWTAAPFPPHKPLGRVHLFPDGRVRLETPEGVRIERPGRKEGEIVELRVSSAFVAWPLLQVRQVVPLAFGGQPLAARWVKRTLRSGARRWTADAPHKPRVSLREDVLFGPPGAYVLREPADGGGLVLAPDGEQR